MQVRHYTLRAPASAPKLRIDYASALNEEQLAVVEAPDGPLLVIAGAGTGKTRALTYRVARLIELGAPAESLMLLTFTNKAAREMLRRLGELCGGLADVRRIAGGTFHHVGHQLLREHASVLGMSERFTLIDREDARELMASCVGDVGVAIRARRFPKAEVLCDLFSMAVNTQKPLLDLLAERRPQFLPLAEQIVSVVQRYVERKLEMELLDFDDLLLRWKELLSEHPEVRRALQERFRCVLVDEYQDTNRLQGDIVDLMAQERRNVAVVGDDAQSIYSFRGADFTNIIDFPARYPGAQVLRLTQNYRSTPQILQLSNASIAQNRRQFPKELKSTRADGPLPALVPLADVYQQAQFVAQRVLELRDEGVPLKEMAVLYRAHHHSMELQVELSRRGIPFVVRSGVRFFEQAHIKDVLAHLKFIHNPQDELAFKRVAKLYPGVGTAAADALWRAMLVLGDRTNPLHALGRRELLSEIPPRSRPGVERCRAALLELSKESWMNAPGEMVLQILQGGYKDYLESQFLDGDRRADDIRQLADYAGRFPSVGDFLGDVSLLSEFSAEEVVDGKEPDEYLTLSSVHQAKGLEWKVVFTIWLAEGRFPLAMAMRSIDQEEEERRLFYVACTRAKDELYLSYPTTASPKDSQRILLSVSRFVSELPVGEAAPFEKVLVEVEPVPQELPAAASPKALRSAPSDEGE